MVIEVVKIRIMPKDVVPIRIAYANGKTIDYLAEKYGVTGQAIRNVLYGKTYKNII